MLDQVCKRLCGQGARPSKFGPPVALLIDGEGIKTDTEPLTRQNFANAVQHRPLTGRKMEGQITVERQWIGSVLDPRQSRDHVERGRIGKGPPRRMMEIEGLFAHPIPCDVQCVLIAIKNRQGKHSVQTRQQPVDAIFGVPVRNNLSIGLSLKNISLVLEVRSNAPEVVDFPILKGDHAPVSAHQRLTAESRVNHG